MSDEKSLSDWESVATTEEEWLCIKTFESHENVTGCSPKNSNAVVVEVPRDGLPSRASRMPYRDQESSIGSSFVNSFNGLDVAKNNDEASHTSEMSGTKPTLTKKMPPSSGDESYSSSSSWYRVSNATSYPSYAAPGWSSTATSSSESVTSNFDVISLSGRTVVRCKRCKYHNAQGTTICGSCNLALVANPCLSEDEQLAWALQLKEEKESESAVLQHESKYENLKCETLFNQSSFIAQEFGNILQNHDSPELRRINELDLIFLLSGFIDSVTSSSCEKVALSLQYTFTSASDVKWDYIRTQGFDSRQETWNDVERAFDRYCPLETIPEDNSDSDVEEEGGTSTCRGWIVLMAEFFAGNNKFVCTDKRRPKIIPMVAFDPRIRESDLVTYSLVRGLFFVVNDVFGCLLEPEPTYIAPFQNLNKKKKNPCRFRTFFNTMCAADRDSNTTSTTACDNVDCGGRPSEAYFDMIFDADRDRDTTSTTDCDNEYCGRAPSEAYFDMMFAADRDSDTTSTTDCDNEDCGSRPSEA